MFLDGFGVFKSEPPQTASKRECACSKSPVYGGEMLGKKHVLQFRLSKDELLINKQNFEVKYHLALYFINDRNSQMLTWNQT